MPINEDYYYDGDRRPLYITDWPKCPNFNRRDLAARCTDCGHPGHEHTYHRCITCWREEGIEVAYTTTIKLDNHGPYIDFGAQKPTRFRPERSRQSPGVAVRAFNKEREAAGTTMFKVGQLIEVSPAYKSVPNELDPEGPPYKEPYLVVYTKDRRELWCCHGLAHGAGYDPLTETPGSGEVQVVGSRRVPSVMMAAPRFTKWLTDNGFTTTTK